MAKKSLHDYFNGETRFGKLCVLHEVEKAGSQRKFLCRCDCGSEKAIYGQHLKRGNSRSCGCEIVVGRPTHGKFYEPGYARWNAMMSRCYHPNNKHYSDYGGRGITVCERWRNVTNFLADMGNPPKGLSLDRIDYHGNYEPSNCRWADDLTQASNRRSVRKIKYNGREITLKEASALKGVPVSVLRKRLRRDWPVEKAIETPLRV